MKLDLVREHKPRFVPAAVVAEFAAILRLYGINEIQSDAFAGGFHADEWTQHAIRFVPCERTTSENYLAALPVLLSGRARLVDNATLRQQLAGLERRVHAGQQRESVSHAATASAHDDVATSACGAIVIAASRGTYNLFNGSFDWDGPPRPPSWAQQQAQRHYDELLARFGKPVALGSLPREYVDAAKKEAAG